MLYFGVAGCSVTVLGLVGRPIWEPSPLIENPFLA